MKSHIESLEKELMDLKEYVKNITPYQSFLFDGNENNGLNGIIRYLTSFSGGNVHEKGVVDVSSSSIYPGDYYPRYVASLDDKEHFFASDRQENAFLTYDFKTRKVHPTHYTIRTRNSYDHYHPCNWVIEGSNDGLNWKQLDRRENERSLVGLDIKKTFCIEQSLEANERYRYLRIKLIGADSDGNYYLVFSALEYFGFLY